MKENYNGYTFNINQKVWLISRFLLRDIPIQLFGNIKNPFLYFELLHLNYGLFHIKSLCRSNLCWQSEHENDNMLEDNE